MTIFLLVLSLILFIGLVVVHEWGHFVAARRSGVDVEEFGIGFPPKVWAKKIRSKKSKFIFSINLLPLGGFVRLKGENAEDKRPGSFGAASLPAKVKIMLAGVAMNAVVAFVMFTILAATGMPKIIDDQFTVASDTKTVQEVQNSGVVIVNSVEENTPAAQAGIKADDQILAINNEQITSADQVANLTESNAGKTVPILIGRDGNQITVEATLNKENSGNGYLGIASQSGASGIEVTRSTWSSPIVALGLMKQISALTFQGLGTAISNLAKGNTEKASEQVAGPVGIFYILREGTKIGLGFILFIIAIISLTLALLNALPIPALDGGRLFVTLLFAALKKPLTKRTEEAIHGTGFAALILLIVLITIVDVNRFF
ncbi:MAG TPA: M50 family metallopeptidase [Candidatus Saccharimonadales bacterium]|nr:M50 family metallopeptidase [Candidatus Saccharimonadales bacterium]